MSQQTPLAQVKAQHENKEKLVAAVVDLIDRGEESKDDLKKRLQSSSNAKLMRLHSVAREVKERFGSKEKLVDALLALSRRSKDKDFREKLLRDTPVKLLALHQRWEKYGA